jgi:hypothetical protein
MLVTDSPDAKHVRFQVVIEIPHFQKYSGVSKAWLTGSFGEHYGLTSNREDAFLFEAPELCGLIQSLRTCPIAVNIERHKVFV